MHTDMFSLAKLQQEMVRSLPKPYMFMNGYIAGTTFKKSYCYHTNSSHVHYNIDFLLANNNRIVGFISLFPVICRHITNHSRTALWQCLLIHLTKSVTILPCTMQRKHSSMIIALSCSKAVKWSKMWKCSWNHGTLCSIAIISKVIWLFSY